MGEYNLDFSEFDALVQRFEQLGGDTDALAKTVLDAGTEPARKAFQDNVPRGTQFNPQGHAADNITVSGVRTSRNGNKFKTISFKGDRAYLYMVDSGTSKMAAHPWRDKARKAAQSAAQPAMQKAMEEELGKALGGK